MRSGALLRDPAGAASRRRRARGAGLPGALELAQVGDDRPPVRRRNRPAVRGHQRQPVGDDLEDESVGVLQDPLLVEGGSGDVGALEQDPLALASRVVARLAIDPVALAPALAKRIVHGHRDRRDELSVRSLAGEEGRVLFQSADRDGSRHGQAHRRAVVEERAGRLGAHLGLIVHARIDMDGRTARRAAAGAAREADERHQNQPAEDEPMTGRHVSASVRTPLRSGFGLRTLDR